jgi:hypothetical protein
MAARDDRDRGSDKGRVKVRVIEFELDGSNQTLRESIRDIVGAIGGRPQQQLPRAIGVQAPPLNGRPTPAGAEEAVVSMPEGAIDDGDDDDEGDEGGGSSTRARRSPPRTPQILEIDFHAGDQPLSDLARLLKLEEGTDLDRYNVIAWWLKHKRQIEEITADHIHTAYRHLDWNTPADATQPLRALKGRSYGYMRSGSKRGTFVITHIGENRVNDLVKKAGTTS